MKKPYLIQRVGERGEVRGNEGTFDQILSCDYMGSAEFEFGALPESLKRICKNFSEFVVYTSDEIKNKLGQDVCVLIKPEHFDEYLCYIENIISGKIRLKEQTYIEAFITGKKFNRQLTTREILYGYNIWWDIENDVFFTFGPEKMDVVISAIKATKEKKKKENAEGWF